MKRQTMQQLLQSHYSTLWLFGQSDGGLKTE